MKGDITIKCMDCGKDFVITANEAKFITSHVDKDGKPYTIPKRCKPCRVAKKKRFEEKELKAKQRDLDRVLDQLNRGERIILQ